MTELGKLMAALLLTVGLGLMTWSVSTYVQRPGWFGPVPEGGVDKGNSPITFAQLKSENEALVRATVVANDTWGANLKELEDREKFRTDRLKAFAERTQWSRTGNPKDLINPADPKSGRGFYAPNFDPVTKLYDLSLDATGKPKITLDAAGMPKGGDPILGSDNVALRGVDQLTDSVKTDADEIKKRTVEILDLRDKFDAKSREVLATEDQLLRMTVIRDSIRRELFYLERFKGNVSETGATVFRRQKQLIGRLRSLGVIDP